ncbi:MAG TPA: hypothetical protein VGM82_02910 [Gemmatimonadaceae bacterium]|jgi:hypothetical protein
MHPPRPKRTSDPKGIADRLVDWLLSHCPFCTLGVLSLIVLAPTLGPIGDPLVIAVPIVVADIAFLVVRRIAAHPTSHSTSLGAK